MVRVSIMTKVKEVMGVMVGVKHYTSTVTKISASTVQQKLGRQLLMLAITSLLGVPRCVLLSFAQMDY